VKSIPLIWSGILLLSLSQSPLRAEPASWFTGVKEKFFDKNDSFYPSFRIMQEYDDNIYLQERQLHQASWKTFYIPSIKFKFPGAQTFFNLIYTPTFIYYYSRDDKWDINQNASLDLRHDFTPRWSAWGREEFRRKEDPSDTRSMSIAQRNARYQTNYAALGGSYNLTRKFYLLLDYENEWINYDKRPFKEFYDRISHNGDINLRYQPNPSDKLECSYRYRRTNYYKNDSDYSSHLVSLALSHRWTKQVDFNIRGGYERRDYDRGVRYESPYFKIGLNILFNRDFRISLRGWHKIEDTFEFSHQGYREDGVEGELHYYLTARVCLNLNSAFIFSHYPPSLCKDNRECSADEDYLRLEGNIAYEVKKYLFLELGYRYTDNNSDFNLASYRRNQLYLAVSSYF
jgi:hypothetical protein